MALWQVDLPCKHLVSGPHHPYSVAFYCKFSRKYPSLLCWYSIRKLQSFRCFLHHVGTAIPDHIVLQPFLCHSLPPDWGVTNMQYIVRENHGAKLIWIWCSFKMIYVFQNYTLYPQMWYWRCEAKTRWIISLFKFYLLLFSYNSTGLEGNRLFSLTNTAFQADWLPIFIIRISISQLFVTIFATILTASPKLKNKCIFEWLGRRFYKLTDLRNMISILCVSS